MSDYYILDDNKQVVSCDVRTWAAWLEGSEKRRRVAFDEIGPVHISTVFLGLDHRFSGEGPPIIFETMIFGGEHNDYQDRCSTYEQALKMHADALALVKKGN
jgi:hypothetical protein